MEGPCVLAGVLGRAAAREFSKCQLIASCTKPLIILCSICLSIPVKIKKAPHLGVVAHNFNLRGPSGPHREFQDRQGCIDKLYLKKRKQKERESGGGGRKEEKKKKGKDFDLRATTPRSARRISGPRKK